MILSPRFEQALQYAAVVHAGQLRKGTRVPYLSHLLAVTAIVLEHGGDETEAVAALLHDAVEDAGGAARLADIRLRFGDEVAAVVEGCTDADTQPKPPWPERKARYVAHLAAASRSVQLVSAADKLHNLRSILDDHRNVGPAAWDRFKGKKAGTLWYYRSLLGAYRDVPPALLAELHRTLAELERRAEGDGYRPADGTDEEALLRAVAEAEARHRRPPRGIQ
jgi:GTP pyrophosphokinase